MRLVVVFFCVAAILVAQGPSVTLSADGQVIYLRTLARPTGSSHSPWEKVYRLDAQGVTLVHDGSDTFDMTSISASADGRTLAVSSSLKCWSGGSCFQRRDVTRLITPQGERTVNQWSADVGSGATYALLLRLSRTPIDHDRQLGRLTLPDGQAVEIPALAPAPSGVWIAADGTILGVPLNDRSPGRLALFRPDGSQQTLPGVFPSLARVILAPDASSVVYEQNGAIWRYEIPGDSRRLLVQQGSGSSLSADARRLLYLAEVGGRPQVFLLENTTTRQISSDPYGVREAQMSGDGNWAVALTGTERVLVFDLATGASKVRREAFPLAEKLGVRGSVGGVLLTGVRYPLVPGSTYQIKGANLAGARVTADGQATTPIASRNNELYYQVAESAGPLGERPIELTVRTPGATWESVWQSAGLLPAMPLFFELDRIPDPRFPGSSVSVFAIHGDWHGLVTDRDPALPGNIIHLYVSGLGPCPWKLVGANPVYQVDPEVLYAGPAPGLTGIGQLTLRLPDNVPGGMDLYLSCAAMTYARGQRSAPAAWIPTAP